MQESNQDESEEIIQARSRPQQIFLASPADIAFYGGAAGGGKSYALLMDPTTHFDTPNFIGIIFRRNSTEIKTGGGLWDTSQEIYRAIGALPREGPLDWENEIGWQIKMSHLEYENDIYKHQGGQYTWIGFDEVTHFTLKQFLYICFSRGRSAKGLRATIRATCNPDADSWVKEWVLWYLDDKGRYADPDKSGVIRYVMRRDEKLIWADTEKELYKDLTNLGYAKGAKTFTFVPAKLEDNKYLSADGEYDANLQMLDKVERERLRAGDWSIVASPGIYFKREMFKVVEFFPELNKIVRFWDRAATEKTEGVQVAFRTGKKKKKNSDPDFTCSVKMGYFETDTILAGGEKKKQFVIVGLSSMQKSAGKVEQAILNTASQDTVRVEVGGFQDPGGAGKGEIERFVAMLVGYVVQTIPATQNVETMIKPVSAQAEFGNIWIWSGIPKNELNEFFTHLESVPDPDAHDDYAAALGGAFHALLSSASFYCG